MRRSGKEKKQLCIFEYGLTVSKGHRHDSHSLWLHVSIILGKAELFQHISIIFIMKNK